MRGDERFRNLTRYHNIILLSFLGQITNFFNFTWMGMGGANIKIFDREYQRTGLLMFVGFYP